MVILIIKRIIIKYESRKLKSAKRRKAYERAIISDLKYDAKMQHKYGLA